MQILRSLREDLAGGLGLKADTLRVEAEAGQANQEKGKPDGENA